MNRPATTTRTARVLGTILAIAVLALALLIGLVSCEAPPVYDAVTVTNLEALRGAYVEDLAAAEEGELDPAAERATLWLFDSALIYERSKQQEEPSDGDEDQPDSEVD